MKVVIFRPGAPISGEEIELSMIRIITSSYPEAIKSPGGRWRGTMFEITQPDSVPSICLKKVDNTDAPHGMRIEPIRQSVVEVR